MKKIQQAIQEFGLAALALTLPVAASAAASPGVTIPASPINSVNDISGASGVLCQLLNWTFYLLIIATIFFILLAAFKYLTAAGDPEKVKAAGSSLLYAVVAIAVALIAKGIPYIVGSFLGGGGFAAC